VEGAHTFTPLQTAKRVLRDLQITTFKLFDRFHCLKDWIQPKNKIWTRMDNFFLWGEHPFQCCVTPNVHRSYESFLRIWNLPQTLVIPWIAHKFVKTIQGGCVHSSNWKDTKCNSQIYMEQPFVMMVDTTLHGVHCWT
jgi:hypothetical protein